MPLRRLVLPSVLAVALAACGGGGDAAPTAPGTAPIAPPPSLDVATIRTTTEMIVEDSVTGAVVAYSHRDHWHGFPVVPSGAAGLPLRLWFSNELRDADDHDIPARRSWFRLDALADHNVRVVVADTTAARWEGTGSGGRLVALRANAATLVSFVVRRGTTTLNERPPLNIVLR